MNSRRFIKPEIVVNKSGPEGNIFMVIGMAIRMLELSDQKEASLTMQIEILEATKGTATYLDILKIVDKYCTVILV